MRLGNTTIAHISPFLYNFSVVIRHICTRGCQGDARVPEKHPILDGHLANAILPACLQISSRIFVSMELSWRPTPEQTPVKTRRQETRLQFSVNRPVSPTGLASLLVYRVC